MKPPGISKHTLHDTAGGTLLSMISLPYADLLQTAVLAAIGASVSCITSLLLQRLLRKRKAPD